MTVISVRGTNLDTFVHIHRPKSDHCKKVDVYKSRRESSEETHLADTLILDFSFQSGEKINFCWLNCTPNIRATSQIH